MYCTKPQVDVRPTRRRLMLALALTAVWFTCSYAQGDEPRNDAPETKAKKNATDTEVEKLHGTWIVKSFVVNGKAVHDNFRYIFSKGKYVMEWEPGRYDFHGPPRLYFDFEIDLKADPKLIIEMVPGTGKRDGRAVWQIYRFRGEQLEICYQMDPKNHHKPPSKFDGSAGSGQILITLERPKGDKKKPKSK